jgi:hypothetical protein
LEHEVFRESLKVAPDLPVQRAGAYAVQVGKVGIKHDLLAAQEHDLAFDCTRWNY